MASSVRVGFFGQTGPYAPPALRRLLERAGPFSIVLVVEGRKTPVFRMQHRLRKPHLAPLPHGNNLGDLAVAAGIPVLQTCDTNASAAVKVLEQHRLDWIVCVGFDRLFSRQVLATARHGGINAHPSDLPSLRGPSPIFWAMRAGARQLTVTLHLLDAGEDHGPLLAKEHFAPPSFASGEELFNVSGDIAGRLLRAALERAAFGRLVGVPQDHALATRAPRPKPEDAIVVPSEWGCEHLVQFACAAPFFRTPWLRLGEDNLFIRRGLRAEVGRKLPGQLVQVGSTVMVQCRDGVAHLEVQV